jgi:hypothetical protein
MSSPYQSEAKTFLNSSFKKYQSIIAKFAPTISSTSADTTKIRRAAVHLAEIAGSITLDFLKANPSITENETLYFTFINLLLGDDRVRSGLGLTSSSWDDLAELPQFTSSEEFFEYLNILRDKDGLDDDIGFACC